MALSHDNTGTHSVQSRADTHLDTGLSRPYFSTVANKVCFGSENLIMLRKSTSRLKKNFSANRRAERSDRYWYTSAVSARGTDASASAWSTAFCVVVVGYAQGGTAHETCEEVRARGARLTVRCQRRMGVTPISRARFAQVVGPAYALTAAFKTRVGRWG